MCVCFFGATGRLLQQREYSCTVALKLDDLQSKAKRHEKTKNPKLISRKWLTKVKKLKLMSHVDVIFEKTYLIKHFIEMMKNLIFLAILPSTATPRAQRSKCPGWLAPKWPTESTNQPKRSSKKQQSRQWTEDKSKQKTFLQNAN